MLFTPVSRRWFDSDGKLDRECHGDYPAAVFSVAEEFGVPVIDANRITQEWLESLGDEASQKYYMWVEPGTCPRHPEGLKDNTHTNVAGARKIVELLLPAITGVIPELSAHVTDYDFVVAKDGSGDFFTVREAVNAAPDYCKQDETKIRIRKGVYAEKLYLYFASGLEKGEAMPDEGEFLTAEKMGISDFAALAAFVLTFKDRGQGQPREGVCVSCRSLTDAFSTILPFRRMRSFTLSAPSEILFRIPMIAPE